MSSAPVSEPIVALDDLSIRYGSVSVIDRFNLRVDEGQVYALLGRNGAGKSSLVRCLLGQQPPSSGQATLFGRDPWKHRSQLMARVGVVPEESDAPPSMTARGLAKFCSALYSRWDQKAFDQRLERFDIALNRPFGKLSRGQKAQVMLALALAHFPELLVLDDPTLGLDVVARRAVFEDLIDELAERPLTVLITSHDLPGIEGLATHLAVVREGRVALDEPLESVKERFRWIDSADAGQRDLLEAMGPILERDRGRGVSVLVERFDEQRFRDFRLQAGADKVEQRVPSLEEVLILLTERTAGGSPSDS